MADPKLLPPNMRDPKRYVVFEVVSESPINYSDLMNSMWNSIMSFLGELGSSDASLWLIQNIYDEKTQRGVMKCKHTFVEEIRVALSLIQYVGETKATIKILGVTGTIKSAKTKYLTSRNLKSFTGEEDNMPVVNE
jgi:ribonuclease P/MRP protein subunit POP5